MCVTMNIYRGRNRTEVYLASVLYDAIEDQDLSSVVKLLEEKKADPNIVLPSKGISCFHLAIGNDSLEFALRATRLILRHGGDPNVLSDEGLTPVHIAAAWGRVDVLDILLRCGGDARLTDNCYATPVHYANAEGHRDAVRLMDDYVDMQRQGIFEDRRRKEFAIALEKIVINNGNIVGEYKISETQPIQPEDTNKINLPDLPQRNNSDYVLTWCNSQDPTNDINEPNFDPLDFDASSQSSQGSHRRVEAFPHVRKKKICYHRESSRESGILTLPEDSNTEEDNKGRLDTTYILSGKKLENLEKNKDNSSDYCTCTDGSLDLNPLERNIFEVTGSIVSRNTTTTDNTFFSIAEVYKYTDDEEKVVLYEKRILTPQCNGNGNESVITTLSQVSLPKTFDYDTDTLRKELVSQGFDPGPITKTTKRVYLKKLYHIKKHPESAAIVAKTKDGIVYSKELQKTLQDPSFNMDLNRYALLEDTMRMHFVSPDPTKKWREGIHKTSFTYLLLDPRVTRDLPNRYEKMEKSDIWKTFLESIFYVGKGKRSRPYSHLYSAAQTYNLNKEPKCDKLRRIINIWNDRSGVVCLHVFQNTIPVEAYTREAAMLSALRLENVTNKKYGDYYGISATWNPEQKCTLGTFLLYKALQIYLHEGERQLFPNDIE